MERPSGAPSAGRWTMKKLFLAPSAAILGLILALPAAALDLPSGATITGDYMEARSAEGVVGPAAGRAVGGGGGAVGPAHRRCRQGAGLGARGGGGRRARLAAAARR